MSKNESSNDGGEQFMDYIALGDMVSEETTLWDGQGGKGPPVGEYDFEILSAIRKQSSKGTPQVEVKFKVITPGEAEGMTCNGWYALTQKAIGRLLCLLNAANVPLDQKNGFSINQLVGATIHASIVETTYKEPNAMAPGEFITKTSTRLQQEVPIAKPAAKGKGPIVGQQQQRR